jgi:hypothetical protein
VGDGAAALDGRHPRPVVLDLLDRDDRGGVGLEDEELAAIYRARGLSPTLAEQVAVELCNRDLDELVEVHARDELGSTTRTRLAPGQQRLRRRSAARSGPRPLPRPAGPRRGKRPHRRDRAGDPAGTGGRRRPEGGRVRHPMAATDSARRARGCRRHGGHRSRRPARRSGWHLASARPCLSARSTPRRGPRTRG